MEEMVRKGNLLYNGGFEAGDLTGWKSGEFGLSSDFDLQVTQAKVYRGNYAGVMVAQKDNAEGYISYDKIISFEDYEAYLFVAYAFLANAERCLGYIYGLDDNGSYITKYAIGYNDEQNKWKRFLGIIRGFAEITHFKVGLYTFANNQYDYLYVDEFKVIPLKSAKSHQIMEEWDYDDLYSNTTKSLCLCVFGECRLESMLTVNAVVGTSPTLDTKIKVWHHSQYQIYEEFEHSQFTNVGRERISADIPDAAFIFVEYTVGGTGTHFDIHHQIRLTPNGSENGVSFA